MLKGLGDLGKMGAVLKQAMEMKGRIEEIRNQLAAETVEAAVGGGMVTVVVNGAMEVLSVKIDPQVVNPEELELLESLIRSAVNTATQAMQNKIKDKMAEVTGGFDIPGLA